MGGGQWVSVGQSAESMMLVQLASVVQLQLPPRHPVGRWMEHSAGMRCFTAGLRRVGGVGWLFGAFRFVDPVVD